MLQEGSCRVYCWYYEYWGRIWAKVDALHGHPYQVQRHLRKFLQQNLAFILEFLTHGISSHSKVMIDLHFNLIHVSLVEVVMSHKVNFKSKHLKNFTLFTLYFICWYLIMSNFCRHHFWMYRENILIFWSHIHGKYTSLMDVHILKNYTVLVARYQIFIKYCRWEEVCSRWAFEAWANF